MVNKFKVNLDLSEGQMMAVGAIAANWSFLEWTLTRIAERLLKIGPKEARVILINATAMEKIKVVRLLATLAMPEPKRDALNTLLDRADKARATRNEIVHGVWATDSNGAYHVLKFRGGRADINRIAIDPVAMSDQDIYAAMDEVLQIAADLHAWRKSNQPE